MNLSVPTAALGIDIAKLKFDVCLLKENGKAKHKVFQNTQHGFEQLIRWLVSHQASDSSTPVWRQPELTANRLHYSCTKPD